MYEGYLELGGVPLINAQATEAYVAHVAPQIPLRAALNPTSLHIANEEDDYRTPVLDSAPWVNPRDASSQGFLGLYPMAIEGLDGSTLAASVTEYLSDGGSVGEQRRTSKSIRVSGLLVGTDLVAAHAGLSWLSAALEGGDCDDCSAGTLRYFLAHPSVCDPGFGEEIGTDSRAFGNLDPGDYRYPFPSTRLDPASPLRARWVGQWQESTILRYGLVPPASITPLYQSDPVFAFRRNYLANPTFRSSLTGWTTASGTWLNADSVDGNGYCRLQAQYSTAPFGTAPFGTSPFGGGAASLTAVSLAPLTGPVVVSLALRSQFGSTVTVSLQGANGQVLGSQTIAPTTTWARYAVTGTAIGSTVTVRITTGGQIDIDQAVLELGAVAGDYFDGGTMRPGYTVSWEGPADASIARWLWASPAEVTWDTADVRPTLHLEQAGALAVQLVWGVRRVISLAEQLLPYERHLFDVACTQGPQVTRIIDLTDRGQGAFIQVEFYLTAGNPGVYSLPESVDTTPITNALYLDPAFAVATAADLSWLADPNAVIVTRPPQAPVIANPQIERITSWTRYYVPIPASQVADWAESVATLTLTSAAQPITQVRIRFHPNPFGYAPDRVDPTSFCSEFIVSYLPASTALELDGVLERATASRGDRLAANADHLIYGGDGGPISWPRLSCAMPYVLTIDVPPTGNINAFDVDVALRRKQ